MIHNLAPCSFSFMTGKRLCVFPRFFLTSSAMHSLWLLCFFIHLALRTSHQMGVWGRVSLSPIALPLVGLPGPLPPLCLWCSWLLSLRSSWESPGHHAGGLFAYSPTWGPLRCCDPSCSGSGAYYLLDAPEALTFPPAACGAAFMLTLWLQDQCVLLRASAGDPASASLLPVVQHRAPSLAESAQAHH